MPSFRTTILAVATAFVATAGADYYIEPDSVPASTRGEPSQYVLLVCRKLMKILNPANWCQSEIATCPLICEDMGSGGASVNTCDPVSKPTIHLVIHRPPPPPGFYDVLTFSPHTQDKLSYGCLCADNKTPNVSQYSLTLPYFTCTQWGIQCVAACGSDNTCASACRQDHPCGALDPSPPNSTNATKTATTTSASSTSTGDAIYTSLGGNDKSAASGPPASELARLYSTMGTLGLFCIGFAYLL